MGDVLKEKFENVEIDDDYVIVQMTKDDLNDNMEFIASNFILFNIENDNTEYYIG